MATKILIEELFLLQRVAQRINSILDLDVLLEEVVSDVARTFGYSRSAILLLDRKTRELEIAEARGWNADFHSKGDRFKIGEYGMTGHVAETGETYYAPDVSVDPYYEISDESTRSELDIPLKVRDHLIGVFNFQHQDLDAFSPERIELLETLAGHVAIAIENAQLFQRERMEKERMARDLDEARRMQTSLFPVRSPRLPGFRIEGMCLPCHEVGGDWFDYIPLKDGRLAIVVADVAGKGMGGALLMTSARSIIRIFAERGMSPGEVLKEANRVLVKDYPMTRFVTMIYGVIDPSKNSFTYASAGHLPPLFMDGNSARFLKMKSGLPLGFQDDNYPEQTVPLEHGERLLLFSDGVNEAMNAAYEEYEMSRLQNHMADPDSSLQTLLDDIHAFTGDSPASDDITLVLVEKA